MGEAQYEKVEKGLELCTESTGYGGCITCPYHEDYYPNACLYVNKKDALALIRQQQERIKAQDEVIRALRKVGYPHNFQREPTWIVNYMYAITDVIKKAVKLDG